jgi:uncharacterized delta-60 repeat protein
MSKLPRIAALLLAPAALAMAQLMLSAGAALAAPADLDPGFGQNGRLTLDESDLARALALQPDGKILVAGDVPTNTPGQRDGVVYRLNPSGALDQSFALGGAVRLQPGGLGGASGLALQPDGRILATGPGSPNDDAMAYRLDPNGSPDQTFGQNGVYAIDSGADERAFALALQPDGKILVAGLTYSTTTARANPVVYRLTPGGTLDDGFGIGGTFRIDSAGSESAMALALQPDGKIVVAGATTANDNSAVVYRLNANGTLDDSFGQGGRFGIDEGGAEYPRALVRQPDGRILVAGYTSRSDNTSDAFVYRLDANGTLDPAFGQGGRLGIDDGPSNAAYAAALQPDGKILVAGFMLAGGDADAVVYRLNRDGSLDPGFDADGARPIDGGGGEIADALAVQRDGRIVVAGASVSGLSQKAMVYRLQGGDPSPASGPAAATSRPRAPVLGRLRIAPPTFRAATSGPSALPSARRRGGLVSFTLDRAASVRFSVERAGSGRRVGGRCVKPTRSNRGKRRCIRYSRLAGGFTRRGIAGANRFRFTGRLTARRLGRASYRLIATPSADGRRGNARRARFRVKG